ncbi:LOW QUALITY PROTEIN: hypothetical protein MAR_013441 [Mya arenaria]|uniref:Uncharacterized protein n=1 Tax=Mya arenaria TaxID=6604 RepID=A0ABY7G1F6_MYAAR|nr:LOW QUALITY PROTEIN: hypothetical protein MAR_013441 [Mya arenaria]
MRSYITRVEVEKIGYRSGKRCQSDQTRSLHDCFSINSIFNSINTRSLPELFSTAWLHDRYTNFFDMSKKFGPSDADQGRPPRPLPINHADLPRQVPDRLIGLDRVDLIGSGSPAYVNANFCSMRKITFFTDSIRPIVEAMRKVKVTRLVFMSSWYTKRA